jgi:hypothetical protein
MLGVAKMLLKRRTVGLRQAARRRSGAMVDGRVPGERRSPCRRVGCCQLSLPESPRSGDRHLSAPGDGRERLEVTVVQCGDPAAVCVVRCWAPARGGTRVSLRGQLVVSWVW